MNSKVKIIHQETTSLGFLNIHRYQLQHLLFSGDWSRQMTRLVVDRGNSVAVLAVDIEQEKVILTRQFRIGALESEDPWLIELIAGIIDDNELPQQSAIREAKEETGATITLQQRIASFYGSPGACSEKTTLFFATLNVEECLKQGGHPSENEDIQVITMSFDEFFEHLDSHRFESASLIIAGLWLKTNLPKVLNQKTKK
jgi:ADP-ribose pyrophosphatase